MSKSKGNVVNPWEVFNVHGADATRWYMYTASPPGNSRRFSVNLVGETVRRFLNTLWNTYSFFVTYANLSEGRVARGEESASAGIRQPARPLGAVRMQPPGARRDPRHGELRCDRGHAPGGRVRGQPEQLVCAPQPPALLGWRPGRGADALRCAGDRGAAAGPGGALRGRGTLSEPRRPR